MSRTARRPSPARDRGPLRPLRTRLVAGALACALALSCAGLFPAAPAFAEVRKADVVLGQTVDARGLSVAQCPSIDAAHAIVMDGEGTVYFERDAAAPVQIASITKIMTAIVALEAGVPLDTTVTVSAEAASIGESTAGLQEGDTMTLEAALKAMMIPSGNDAAQAIAESVGALMGGGYDAFIDAMNEKAAALGMVDSVFENPHGLDYGAYAGNLHSTAADVALMAKHAMGIEEFRSIVDLPSATINVVRADKTGAAIELESTDALLGEYEGAAGIKTGVTQLAGPSFSFAATLDGRDYFAIVLNSSSEAQRFVDATTLVDWVREHEQDYSLAHSPETATMNGAAVPLIAEVPHTEWIDKTVKLTLSDSEAFVRIFDLNGNVSQSLEFDEVKGDVRAGDKLGTITFKQRNAVVATADLVACADVAAPDLFEGIGIWWDRLFRGFSGSQQVAPERIVNETPLVVDKTAVAA